jgi:hypothetical protein
MFYRKVNIHRDELSAVTKYIPHTEIPVLESIWGVGAVKPRFGFCFSVTKLPTESAEYERLEKCYGDDAVLDAYGSRTDGRLHKAMRSPVLAWGVQVVLAQLARFKRETKGKAPIHVVDYIETPKSHMEGMRAAVEAGIAQAESNQAERRRFRQGE